jgi:hypothetical protein
MGVLDQAPVSTKGQLYYGLDGVGIKPCKISNKTEF